MSLTTVDSGLISSGAITLTTQVTGTLPVANGGTGTTTGYYGFKNRIINGAMVIDQRNAGASVTPTSGQYTLDRWSAIQAGATSKFSAQQNAGSVTPPAGFTKYLGITSLSAYAVTSSDYYQLKQILEGYNVADLNWGTASANSITVSFWVRSSLSGSFGLSIKWGGSSANQRSYPILYTISATNTWEYKTIIIPGDTTMAAGGFETGASSGIQIQFSLGGGATNAGPSGSWAGANYQTVVGDTSVVGTNGATFYITGVQLEKGSTATSFDYRPYGTEFDLCRRYFEIYSGAASQEGNIPQGTAQVDSPNRPEIMLYYYPKRTGPVITATGNFNWISAANTIVACTLAGTYVGTFTYGANLFFSSASGVAVASLSGIGTIAFGSSGGALLISAEL